MSQQLHQVVDVWEKRYGVMVWCRSKGAEAGQGDSKQQEGEITVTVSPANGQSEMSPSGLQVVETILKANLEGIVKREGWEMIYPKRVLQAIR